MSVFRVDVHIYIEFESIRGKSSAILTYDGPN